MNSSDFFHVAPYLSNPLVLIGFVLMLFFGIHRTLIKSKIIRPLSATAGSKVVNTLLRYGFIIALAIIIAGFLTQAWKIYNDKKENVDTGKILGRLDGIAKGFESLEKQGGLIANANTPEEQYHNAKIYELNGDFLHARQAYEKFLSHNLDFIDPHLSYQTVLKSQDGIEAARDVYRRMLVKGTPLDTPRFAAILLSDREQRIEQLQSFIKQHPDFAPAYYQMSREYSDATLGNTTLSDKRSEREYLETFAKLDGQGKFVRYFLDKKVADEWRADASARLRRATAISKDVLKAPVTLSAMLANSGWTINFDIADDAKEIFYKFPGEKNYKSTGMTGNRNPRTGLPRPDENVEVGNLKGKYVISVKYTDVSGKENGPFDLVFDTDKEVVTEAKVEMATIADWVIFRYYNGTTWINFTDILSRRNAIKEINYSLDDDSLSRKLPFEVWTGAGTPDLGYDASEIAVPIATKFVCVKLVYTDNSVSELKKIQNTIDP